jgi:hypothetical protein
MRDILVITPSRSRPQRLKEMLQACLSLSTAQTDIAVGVDLDQVNEYADVGIHDERVFWFTDPRDTLAGWTNTIAAKPVFKGRYRAYASLGDDHVPKTPGWDSRLLAAIDAMGGTGIAYGDDRLMGKDLPTAPVVSADIVEALGWMCLPCCEHMCVDVAWKEIGLAAGCLAYVPEVIIEHVHWCNNGAPMDETYAAAEAVKEADRERYAAWERDGMAADVDKVKALMEARAA